MTTYKSLIMNCPKCFTYSLVEFELNSCNSMTPYRIPTLPEKEFCICSNCKENIYEYISRRWNLVKGLQKKIEKLTEEFPKKRYEFMELYYEFIELVLK